MEPEEKTMTSLERLKKYCETTGRTLVLANPNQGTWSATIRIDAKTFKFEAYGLGSSAEEAAKGCLEKLIEAGETVG